MKMGVGISILSAFLFCCFGGLAKATIVDVIVTTNKPVYQLGEYVAISITAYNPNPESVTLTFGTSLQATYTIDDAFNWYQNKYFLQVVTYRTINAYDFYTWNLVHGLYGEMSLYPLSIGYHSVVGKIGAMQFIGEHWQHIENNESPPLQFEVIPEPATLAFIATGLPVFRALLRREL